jgi:hypothetical protein
MGSKKVVIGLCGSVILALLVMPVTSVAATLIRQVTHTDAFKVMGQEQPAKDDTSTIWMDENKACMSGEDNKLSILRADKGVMYFIDHEKKAYTEMPIEALGDIKKMAGIEDDEEAAQAAEMIQGMAAGMMSMEVTVTPTDEKKKIKDWHAKKYVVEVKMPMGSTKSQVWATEDIEIDYDMFTTISNAFMAKIPGFEQAMEELKKVKGLRVLSIDEAQVMGTSVKTTTTLLECSRKPAPSGIFDVPKGYKKTEMPEMGQQ